MQYCTVCTSEKIAGDERSGIIEPFILIQALHSLNFFPIMPCSAILCHAMQCNAIPCSARPDSMILCPAWSLTHRRKSKFGPQEQNGCLLPPPHHIHTVQHITPPPPARTCTVPKLLHYLLDRHRLHNLRSTCFQTTINPMRTADQRSWARAYRIPEETPTLAPAPARFAGLPG